MRRRKVTGCATPLPTLHPLVLALHPLITASARAQPGSRAKLNSGSMDVLNTLPVRFHFNGDFLVSGREKHYVGGSEAMSYLDQDNIPLPEIVGHLCDHCKVAEGTMLHLLFPGKDLNSELRALLDDSVCQYMNDCIVGGGVAEVYADAPILVDLSYEDEGSDYELEMEEDMGDESDGNEIE
ncbi:hypothetical protein OsJ_26986 [Oryza sativa Japonica Group]|uniref:Uncharacterized protein n=2 Tax=Oryza TaxID=4527 RepID=A3BS70_ORYSJ|nr:hypothetical protein OsJ_26986 [Oryza sativa Japonica Group]